MKIVVGLVLVAVCAAPSLAYKCDRPLCAEEEIFRLWPVEDEPQNYYQCNPKEGGFEAVKRPCEGDLLFHFGKQSCVPEKDWKNYCAAGEESEETDEECGCIKPKTTPAPTESESEETDEECGCIKPKTTPAPTESESEETDEECGCIKPKTTTTTTKKPTTTTTTTTKAPTTTKTTTTKTTTTKKTTTTTEESESEECPEPKPIPPKNPECGRPRCDTKANSEYLWPGKTPRTYYKCAICGKDKWAAQLNECTDSKESHFSYTEQKCVPANKWKNECTKAFAWLFPEAEDILPEVAVDPVLPQH